MELLPLIPLAAFLLFLIGVGANTFFRYRFGKPSEFAAGIARSLKSEPRSWDYDANEKWLISSKAAIAVSIQSGNFGQVDTMQNANQGTHKIDVLRSSDGRAFRSAFIEWLELTALDRKTAAERRKRDAVQALAA